MNETDNINVNTMLTVVTPPSLYFPIKGPKIFLAGSVGNGDAPDWQSSTLDYIQTNWTESNVTIYNPRRPSGEFLPEDEAEQATWTISMLNAADYIVMHLTGDSGSPISTFELGLFVDDERMHLSIDEGYSRKEVVEIHYAFFGDGKFYDGPEASIDAIKSKDWIRNSSL